MIRTNEEVAGLRALVWATIVLPILLAIASLYWQSPTLTFLVSLFATGLLSVSMLVHALRSLRSMAVFVVFVSLLLATARTNWPLRVAFWFQKSALEHLASDVGAGKSVEYPIRLGIFQVLNHEFRKGEIFFVTDPSPAGRSGFLRTENSESPISARPSLRFDQNWWFVEED